MRAQGAELEKATRELQGLEDTVRRLKAEVQCH